MATPSSHTAIDSSTSSQQQNHDTKTMMLQLWKKYATINLQCETGWW